MPTQRPIRDGRRTITTVAELFFLLFLAAGSAISQDVRFNFDKSADFSKFRTYRWVTLKDAAKVDELTDKDIKAAVNADLSKKGLEIDDSDNADLDIGYRASVGEEKQFSSYSSGWGWGPGGCGGGWYGWPGWSGFTTTTTGQTSTIYIGQLNVDFYDSHGNLIWRGAASQTIDPDAKPEKQQKKLEKAVAKLLKNFPMKSKGG